MSGGLALPPVGPGAGGRRVHAGGVARGTKARQATPHPWRQLAIELRKVGYSWVRIADVLRRRYGVSALVAMRWAHGWSQADAAAAWCRLWPDEPKSFKQFSYWETWSSRTGCGPSLRLLDRLARLYRCRVSDLLVDVGDYRRVAEETTVLPEVQKAADEAFGRAEALLQEAELCWPGVWARLDTVRRDLLASCPSWCLLPSAAAAVVTGWSATGAPSPAAAVCALYAWRFTGSVYVYEPRRAAAVMRRSPDDLTTVDPLQVLPDWCVYVAGGHPGWPGAGLWAVLDADHDSGVPLLRLLVDLGEGGIHGLVPIPVRLDKPVVEAVAEDRGIALDGAAAKLADVVDRLIALVTYPADPHAKVHAAEGEPTRSGFARHLVSSRTVWTVGFPTT